MAAMSCNHDISDYLQGVKFKKKGESGDGVDICEFDTTGDLRKKLFSDKVFNFDDAKAEIKSAVEQQCAEKIRKGRTGWVQCSGPCFAVLHKYSKEELKSTAFILKLLAKSMIDITKTKEQIDDGDDGKEVTVIYDGKPDFSEITGHWMKGKKHGDMEHFTIDIKHDEPRLIMALGPSSAGKTFSGTTVMKMIKQAKKDFPTKFLSIDGGIYREESIVYQTILDALKRYKEISGFKDLVSPNKWEEIKHGTIFSSGTAKKEITAWMKRRGVRISLYIPETLGAPDTAASRPYSKIEKYVDITGDTNWIGLLIWQHLNDGGKKKKKKIGKWKVMCNFPDGQKCKGTVPLGMKRQEGEGKMYSPDSWWRSMLNGEKMLKKAKGLRVDLHNSGQPGKKSTIREYPLEDGRTYVFTKQLVEKNNMVYHKAGELPEESESGPETEAPLADYPQILMVKRGPEDAAGTSDMFINRQIIAAGGKRSRKRKRKRKRTKRKKRRKRKKGTKRRKKRTRRR